MVKKIFLAKTIWTQSLHRPNFFKPSLPEAYASSELLRTSFSGGEHSHSTTISREYHVYTMRGEYFLNPFMRKVSNDSVCSLVVLLVPCGPERAEQSESCSLETGFYPGNIPAANKACSIIRRKPQP